MSRVRARSVEKSADLVADTLPQLLRRNAAIMAHRPAIREKTLGIWRTFSWAEYERQVREFALGLAAYGFRRGDKLAVIGDNRPRLYGAQLAAQCLGGIAVPIYRLAACRMSSAPSTGCGSRHASRYASCSTPHLTT